jgi:hypothetical protein
MSDRGGLVQMSLAIAAVTLADRKKRRKLISGLLLLIVGVFVVGNWPMKSWVDASLWRLLFWWGGCTLLCLLLVLFAVFDALAVIREEKRKLGMSNPLEDEDLPLE